MEKPFSEAAKIFFEQFLKILEDFKKETKLQVFLLNREGELISKLEGVQPACKMILSFEEGKVRCKDSFKIGFSIVKTQKTPFFFECFASFPICALPIVIENSFIGTVIVCGGKYEKGESEEKIKERFLKLADEIGIFDKERFLHAQQDQKILTKEDFEKEIKKLEKLIKILTEHIQTPLKEVFG